MQIRGDEENTRKKEKTNMQTRTYQEIELKKLKANPWNPRKNFEGPKFEDLVNSIKTKGVLEPILVRPLKKDKFEIVAGERRWRASMAIAESNGGLNGQKIPAVIQEMDDDTALEIMTIENLQREDLTELEEANNYKLLVDRKGPDYIPQLAEKLGTTAAYIRRRISVLKNPEPVLKAWEAGKIKYGHCEELARLDDEKQILAYLKRVTLKDRWDPKAGCRIDSVRELRDEINKESLELALAKFDLEKEGCLSCHQNSDQQKKLFGEAFDAKKSHCLNPVCFKKKQNDYLMANWKKHRGKSGTNGFRFDENCGYGQFNEFNQHYGKPGQKCKECAQFISIIDTTGKIRTGQACVGKKECYNEVRAEVKKDEKKKLQKAIRENPAAAPDPGTPRVAWHGEYFREEFFKTEIPKVMNAMPAADLSVLRVLLAGVLDNNPMAKETFGEDHKIKKDKYSSYRSTKIAWAKILELDPAEICQALRQAAIDMVLWQNFGADMRYQVACHIGIVLSRDWRLHREYLEKKTTKELLYLGAALGIFKDEKALKFLYEVLLKKRKRFDTCKKEELIKIFLDSGIDLAGKVPDEILVDKVVKREAQPAGAVESDPAPVFGDCDQLDQDGVCNHLREHDCLGFADCCRRCPEECENRCNKPEAPNAATNRRRPMLKKTGGAQCLKKPEAPNA
jgi:ParB family chromosome partitioning protein